MKGGNKDLKDRKKNANEKENRQKVPSPSSSYQLVSTNAGFRHLWAGLLQKSPKFPLFQVLSLKLLPLSRYLWVEIMNKRIISH